MSSVHDVSVYCPRCDNEITLTVEVSGGYSPASRWEPAEYPEFAYDAPAACSHVVLEGEEFDPGPYTQAEMKALDEKIVDAATAAMEADAFDPAWDGPDHD